MCTRKELFYYNLNIQELDQLSHLHIIRDLGSIPYFTLDFFYLYK